MNKVKTTNSRRRISRTWWLLLCSTSKWYKKLLSGRSSGLRVSRARRLTLPKRSDRSRRFEKKSRKSETTTTRSGEGIECCAAEGKHTADYSPRIGICVLLHNNALTRTRVKETESKLIKVNGKSKFNLIHVSHTLTVYYDRLKQRKSIKIFLYYFSLLMP